MRRVKNVGSPYGHVVPADVRRILEGQVVVPRWPRRYNARCTAVERIATLRRAAERDAGSGAAS